jgi:hypothetical protein
MGSRKSAWPELRAVLLDHVHQRLTQAGRLTHPVAPGHFKVGRLLDEAVSESRFLTPGSPGARHCLRVGYSPLNAALRRRRAGTATGVLAVGDTAGPMTLNVRGR